MPGARRALRSVELIVTCEHGGNDVPRQYRGLISQQTLASHRGYDPGALALARDFASALGAKLYYSTTSRLLIELNRTLDHPQLFSRYALLLPAAARQKLIRHVYLPYWRAVEAHATTALERGDVIHVSSHSFTPKMAGVRRTADVGLLFDPRHRLEAAFCRVWYRALRKLAPKLRVRNNYPYKGTGNGLTTALRAKFAGRPYLGVEIEVNQRFARAGGRVWREVRSVLTRSLVLALAEWNQRRDAIH
jgi:predicted N-formylglutamate amidohydrolase